MKKKKENPSSSLKFCPLIKNAVSVLLTSVVLLWSAVFNRMKNKSQTRLRLKLNVNYKPDSAGLELKPNLTTWLDLKHFVQQLFVILSLSQLVSVEYMQSRVEYLK